MEMNKAPHTVPEIKSIVKYNGRLVSHKLERISNGSYQLSFLPLKSGYYHVNFYKNGQKIEGKNIYWIEDLKLKKFIYAKIKTFRLI